MIAALPTDGGDIGGGGGGGGGSPISPSNNTLLNWGPLASASDKLFVPGVSDPMQGVFDYPRQDSNPTTEQPKTQLSGLQIPDNRTPAGGGGVNNKTPWGQGLFGTFLRGIMTPAQYNRYGSTTGNAFLVGRQ